MSVILSFLLLVQAAAAGTVAIDYPPEALKNHWEGVAVAELTIDPAGHVSSCRIVKSAGHKVLDDATCDLMVRRAIFKPATDSSGKPVESKFTTPPITWHIGH